MRVYAAKFNGYQPVGACAIVVAESQPEAEEMLAKHLDTMGLATDGAEYEELSVSAKGVFVLLDGEY